ncbi:MAG: ABC transporter ATP-binding protein [Candidatus Kariarchaeaceae archaeon]|jgi:ABC-type lipoprotein export system ATPase subunit
MAFLECNDVIKLYTDEQTKLQVPALRGVELTANEGELVSIIGPSGSGKSTLINLIGGIDKPSSGDIILDGNMITKFKERELTKYRRERIGFLYQLPERNLIWNLSALKNTIVPMRLSGKWSHGTQKNRALELLKDVGLEHRKNHKPHQLSGGEAQRVGIAVALANDPDIILADEPTGELDSLTTFKIIDYFKQLNDTLGKTFIVVTHDHRFANMTTKAMKIMDGRITGLHRAIDPRKSFSDREEVIFVDDHGNLRLPMNIREEAGIKNHVQIRMQDGFAMIIPVRGDDLDE